MIFDFDGTLADTYDSFASDINGVADRYGFRRFEAEDAERFRGLNAREIIRELGMPSWKLPLIVCHMHAIVADDIASVRLFSGVTQMLRVLHGSGHAIVVVSSNAETDILAVLGPDTMCVSQFNCGASLFGKGRLRLMISSLGISADYGLAIGHEICDLDAAREAGCALTDRRLELHHARRPNGATRTSSPLRQTRSRGPPARVSRRRFRVRHVKSPRVLRNADSGLTRAPRGLGDLVSGENFRKRDQMPLREPGASDPPPALKGS